MQDVNRQLVQTPRTGGEPEPAATPATFGAYLRLVLLSFPRRFLSGDFVSKSVLQSRLEREGSDNPLLGKYLADIERRLKSVTAARRSADAYQQAQDTQTQVIAKTRDGDRSQRELAEELELKELSEREIVTQKATANNLPEALAGKTPEERKKFLELLKMQEPESGPAT